MFLAVSDISVLDWIVSILMFIIALAVLITIHELGHFSMAKLFNVYCQEFSIGFGPKLLKKRRKGGETYFSIRAIPLGGYVSMYGEEVKLDDGVNVPEERSLEGIKKWKKAIILVAGVALNLVLGYVFIFISDVCFPTVYLTNTLNIEEDSKASSWGLSEDDELYFYGSEIDDYSVTIAGSYDGTFDGYAGYIIDSNVEYNDTQYVLVYVPTSNKTEPVFVENVYLFEATETPDETLFASWIEYGYSLDYYPDFSKDYLHAGEGVSYDVDLIVNYTFVDETVNYDKYTITMTSVSDNDSTYYYEDIGITFKNRNEWAPFSERLNNTFIDFGSASSAIVRGIGQIFTGQGQVSGIIGIMTQSATIYSSYTFATYLYFWAVISINLAFFNLLPFPGLDGWALLVTVIEGISRKKIPNKVKNIVSTIGLIILFGLMVVIIVIDILRTIGIM